MGNGIQKLEHSESLMKCTHTLSVSSCLDPVMENNSHVTPDRQTYIHTCRQADRHTLALGGLVAALLQGELQAMVLGGKDDVINI